MEPFYVKVLPFVLIIFLMKSCVSSAESSLMRMENGKSGPLLVGGKNDSTGDNIQHVSGSRRALLNDPYGFRNRHRPCYTQFFVGGQPPEGLRTNQNDNVRYICQPATLNQQPQNTYYATMFDEHLGIAVFSAYTLTQQTLNFVQRDAYDWCPTPGIQRQGSKLLYQGQGYDRGHLVPGHTFSSTINRFISTYTYTNAVPQFPYFNRGRWSRIERRIRDYAPQCTGTLYLLTGTAFTQVWDINGLQYVFQPINRLHRVGNNPPDIVIPNLMWTAGCCVHQNGNVEKFAVIGNNIQSARRLNGIQLANGLQITVPTLERILRYDIVNSAANLQIGVPVQNVRLFPGNVACGNGNNPAFLPGMFGK